MRKSLLIFAPNKSYTESIVTPAHNLSSEAGYADRIIYQQGIPRTDCCLYVPSISSQLIGVIL